MVLRVKWKLSGWCVLGAFFITIFPSCDSQNVDIREFAEVCSNSRRFITADYESNWEEGLDDVEWKVRMASKLHIYIMAHNLYRTHKFKRFEEDHFKKACFNVDRISGWEFTNTTGYGNHSALVRMFKTANPKVFRFALPYGPFGPSEGTATIIYSDNDLYTAFEFCFDNGLRTFVVISRNQINDHRDGIKNFLKSIGYNEDNIVDLKPNKCEADPKKKDLPKASISFTIYQGPAGPSGVAAYGYGHRGDPPPPPPVFY